MCLLNLVQQDDRVGVAAHLFCKLSPLIVAYVTRRGSYKPAYGVFLHILAHIYPDKAVGGVEEILCKYLCQLRLSYSGGTKEEEGAYRFVGIAKARPVSPYGSGNPLYGSLLSYHFGIKGLLHLKEPVALLFRYPCGRYAGALGEHICNILPIYNCRMAALLNFPVLIHLLEVAPLVIPGISIVGGHSVVGALHSLFKMLLNYLQLPLQLCDFCRYLNALLVHAAARLIHHIYGLVGKHPLCYISLAKKHTGAERIGSIFNIMMLLIALLYALQNVHCLLKVGWLHHYVLEASLQRSILCHNLSELV